MAGGPGVHTTVHEHSKMETGFAGAVVLFRAVTVEPGSATALWGLRVRPAHTG